MTAFLPEVPPLARPVRFAQVARPIRLTGGERMSDDDWPGVVAYLGDDVRLVVNRAVTYFRVQGRCLEDSGRVSWVTLRDGRAAQSLAKEVGPLLDRVPELAEVVALLPDDPAAVASAMASASDVFEAALFVADYRSPDYCRVVAQDGQVRVIVDHSGGVYGLQHCPRDEVERGAWRTMASSQWSAALVRFLGRHAFDPARGMGKASDWTRAHVESRARALVAALPARAGDGHWPELPDLHPDLLGRDLPARLRGG